MYKVIVVGTDGSESAAVALHHATVLAKLTDATLHVVHAHQPLSTSHAAMGATAGMMTANVGEVNAGIADSSGVICERAAVAVNRAGVRVGRGDRSPRAKVRAVGPGPSGRGPGRPGGRRW